MPEQDRQQHFRPLRVRPNRPRREEALFWWLAGIALAVLFLACVAIGYWHRKG